MAAGKKTRVAQASTARKAPVDGIHVEHFRDGAISAPFGRRRAAELARFRSLIAPIRARRASRPLRAARLAPHRSA